MHGPYPLREGVTKSPLFMTNSNLKSIIITVDIFPVYVFKRQQLRMSVKRDMYKLIIYTCTNAATKLLNYGLAGHKRKY